MIELKRVYEKSSSTDDGCYLVRAVQEVMGI
jgi:hypothetical protein